MEMGHERQDVPRGAAEERGRGHVRERSAEGRGGEERRGEVWGLEG